MRLSLWPRTDSFSIAVSFIGDLLRRHPDGHGRWPGEDLLTEATAAVLRQVDELAASVAGFLSERRAPAQVEVDTQVRSGGRRRVDLELHAERDLIVCVEVKDHAGESGDQLARYYDELIQRAAREGAEPRLVYLSRLGADRPSHSEAKVVTWEEFATHIEGWLHDSRDGLDSKELFLIEDYLAYLRERELVPASPLRSHVLRRVVAEFEEARLQLEQLHAILDERVQDAGWLPIAESWGRRAGGKRPDSWPKEWWAAYRSQGGFPEGNDFDFVLELPEAESEPIKILAGLIWRREGGPSPLEDRTWLTDVLRLSPIDGFGEFSIFDAGRRLYRQLALTELDEEQTLGKQAERAASFVTSTFSLLREAGPGSI